MTVKTIPKKTPIRSMTDKRLDFDHAAPLQKSYMVTSSFRCGSAYLCSLLWKTGLLGAPSAVLNSPTKEVRALMTRFKASSPADYIAQLLAHRTSRNGIFGMKVHFSHFEAFLKEYPALLEVLSPVTYIYIYREDKVAQAVSMAKALQTNQWSSRWEKGESPPLQYDQELIQNCMNEIQQQDEGWLRWFEAQKAIPFQVTYERLTADPDGVVRSVVELLGVQNDEPSEVQVPPAEKQSDETNEEWIERFVREARDGEAPRQASVGSADRGVPAAQVDPDDGKHFFDRSERFIHSLLGRRGSNTGPGNLIRLRHRYDAIIAQNRELFRGMRVLSITGARGFWGLAALDAGAAHVVSLDASQKTIRVAEKIFRKSKIKPESYQFINAEISEALQTFNPERFDTILCDARLFEHYDFLDFFVQLPRLRPKHVVLDIDIAPGKDALAQFAIAKKGRKKRGTKITAIPSHALISLLCKPEFQWRLIDWNARHTAERAGLSDYARDERRTYLLDRSPGEAHFFDRRERFIKSLPEPRGSTTGFVSLIRLRHRYDAIIAQNRQFFQNARVLVIKSFDGFWSLAALDAGAAHVVGLETSPRTVKAAQQYFRECGIKPESYEFINSEIAAELQTFNAGQFDVVLCDGRLLEYCHITELFGELSRLRPKHVILDTDIASGQGRLAHYSVAKKSSGARIPVTPNHELIAFLGEDDFQWRLIDWTAMGITDWTGVQDYARDNRRTYVLDLL